MSGASDEGKMSSERSPEERKDLIGLVEALRTLAQTTQDHRIARWLQEVVDKVNQYADAPTRDQMAGALGHAEILVHQRLDEWLTSIEGLKEAVRQLEAKHNDLADRVSEISPEEVRTLIETVQKHEQLFRGLASKGRIPDGS